MSRFGRDYLQVGQYTELFFPSYDVRFIAVNDGVDSDKGDNDFTPIRNLFNDFYAKDTSKKVRAILRARGTSGKHMNRPPYGYKEDPDNRGYWLIDEEAAAVVKRIFDLCIAGKGTGQIARILERDKVLTTRAYQARKKGKSLPEHPYRWLSPSIISILERMEYNGCTCNFKTYSRSYKLKKRIPNKPEDMLIIPDTQEAIVSKEQWDRVQELRKHKRRPVKGERPGYFSNLLYCADCGSKLHYRTCKSFEGKQDHYVCSQYKSGRGDCSAHYIREDVLRDLVLERIQAVNAYIREDRKRIAKAKKRLSDIDTLLTSIYEDSVLGNLSKERYRQMSENYEFEQEQLKTGIAVLEELVETREETNHNYDQFHALTEKYVDVKELTPMIVNEYIKKSSSTRRINRQGSAAKRLRLSLTLWTRSISLPSTNQSSMNSLKTAGIRHDLRVIRPLLNRKVPYR